MKNNEKSDELNASSRVTSVKSEIDIVYLQSSHLRKQSKRHDCLNSSITKPTIESTIFLYNRLISFSIALSYNRIKQTISKGDHEVAVIVYFSHAITLILSLLE